jgi:hypothetical protein
MTNATWRSGSRFEGPEGFVASLLDGKGVRKITRREGKTISEHGQSRGYHVSHVLLEGILIRSPLKMISRSQ